MTRLGAIARCKQIVVVGDLYTVTANQVFCTAHTSDVEDEDGGHRRAAGCPSSGYREHSRFVPSSRFARENASLALSQRHHSLIAVSNHEFYDDRLFIVPSPFLSNPELGLKFHFVEGGIFDFGASATNRIEARAVCRAIVDHAKNSPGLSLGVASFSVKQQKAILDELELARRQDPAIEEFFRSSTEPFFCKNLENVQGDERDVIFISVGYGKNSNGYMAMRFGPLGAEGGERRLNVLISRAKKRCHVFASITANDIDLERLAAKAWHR